MKLYKTKIAIIGLGYVGLPLAIEFGNKFKVTGFDTNKTRYGLDADRGVHESVGVQVPLLRSFWKHAFMQGGSPLLEELEPLVLGAG